jgi:hypothetical protein
MNFDPSGKMFEDTEGSRKALAEMAKNGNSI